MQYRQLASQTNKRDCTVHNFPQDMAEDYPPPYNACIPASQYLRHGNVSLHEFRNLLITD